MKKLLFTLLLAAGTLTGWAEDLYLVGSAVSIDWNINNAMRATKMTETSTNVFEWTGYFKASGQFKILTNKDSWDYGYNATSSLVTLSEPSSIQDRSGGDYQWKVASDGIYKITVNTSDKTIKAESATMTIPTLTDGYYQIRTANDLKNFADAINKGAIAPSVKAKLTANIDMTSITDFTPICCANAIKFTGEFDGQGHAITNLKVDYNTSFGYTGLFCYATDGAVIKNLIVGTGCSFKGTAKIGGIIGSAEGGGTVTLTNVINMANVTSTGNSSANAAGLVGCGQGGTKIVATNCANTGEIHGQDGECAAFAGWTQSGTSFTNCWNIGDIHNMDNYKSLYRKPDDATITLSNCYDANGAEFYTQGTKIARTTVASGELCYKLGHGESEATWTQTIGTDDYPIPFDTQRTVYRYGESDSYWYSNLNSTGTVNISSAKDLTDFSSLVNAGNASLNAELTNDIDMSDVTYTPIGTTTYNYAGTFDGKGFRITHLNINNGLAEQGLFSVCAGATIQNLILDSTCSIKTTNTTYGNAAFVAAVKGSSGTLTFQNCGNEATVIGKKNTAAFVGANKSSNNINISLTNCYNSGTIGDDTNGDEDAVIVAWNDGATLTVTNFYNCGTIKHVEGDSRKRTLGRGNGSWIYSKCYNILSDSQYSGKTNNYDINKVYSGELCVTLDSPFTQDLSQEEGHPTFGSKEVLTGQWFNDSEDDVYYNQDGDDYTVYQLNLDDSKTKYALPDGANVTAKHVSVARSITAGKWVGLCLPFDYAIPSGWDVRELTNVNGTGDEACMIFTAASSIEASKPYLVKTSADVPTITATDKTIVAEAHTIDRFEVNMVGRFKKASINVGDYYITNNSELKKLTDSSVDMKGFRAYFTLDDDSPVKALSFDIEDDADGISSHAPTLSEGDGVIYNVAGLRISRMQKGINIVNGKKVLF
ncbi:MAG: SusF/SusE family outer membrane protein [Bacteroidaceae bacterium]|nr:SusF/SusE family outer membrane protein [Bacteroidaceae bacterium]